MRREGAEVSAGAALRPAGDAEKEDGEGVVYVLGAGEGGEAGENIGGGVAQFSGPGGGPPRPAEIKAGGPGVRRVEVGGPYTPSRIKKAGGPPPQPKPG